MLPSADMAVTEVDAGNRRGRPVCAMQLRYLVLLSVITDRGTKWLPYSGDWRVSYLESVTESIMLRIMQRRPPEAGHRTFSK